MDASLFSCTVDIIYPEEETVSTVGRKRTFEEALQENDVQKRRKIDKLRNEILDLEKKEHFNDNVIKLLRFGEKCEKMDKEMLDRALAERSAPKPEKKIGKLALPIFVAEDYE